MASRSGALISVGPKTIPRFSLDMRFSFSYWVTLERQQKVKKKLEIEADVSYYS